jgi:hypothetical protein
VVGVDQRRHQREVHQQDLHEQRRAAEEGDVGQRDPACAQQASAADAAGGGASAEVLMRPKPTPSTKPAPMTPPA